MKNAKINGVWVDVPTDSIELGFWLTTIVAYDGFKNIETLQPGRQIYRWQTITHVRKNGHGRGINISKLK